MNAPRPEVSVVIPTRNRRELLEVSLGSVLAQRDISLEAIVVDDASSDGAQDFLAAVDDPRVKVLTNEVRRGVSAARNRGIAAARGDWIAFLDDDDRWLPTRLRETVDCGIAAGADFVYGATLIVDRDGRRLEASEFMPPPPGLLARELRRANTLSGPSSVIVSAELLRRTGGFDEEISYLADWEMWHRLVKLGKGARCERFLVEYREHAGGMLLADETNVPRELRHLRHLHPDVDFDAPFMARWYALRLREEGRRWRAARLYVREAVKFRKPSSLARAIAALLGPRPYRLAKRVRAALTGTGAVDEPATEDAEPSREEAGGGAAPIERGAAPGELVSVVIPTRSRPRQLDHSLSTVLAQRGVEFEVIVIDDASPEPVQPITEPHNDPALRVIRLPARAGAAAARNAGLAAARGQWVAFLDDDDGWEPGKLRTQLDAVHELGARWCWCATSMVYTHGPRHVVTVSEPEKIGDLLRHHNAVPGSASSVLAETALVRELGGFDETMPHLADWDLWIRLADSAPAAACQSALVTQYVHPEGMHATETAAAAAEVRPFRAKHPDVRPAALLEWVARAHWRSGRPVQALRYAVAARLPRRATADIPSVSTTR